MAVCDIKVAHIDKAIGAMETAIKMLKDHRKSVLLYCDTADSAKKVADDIFGVASRLSRETTLFLSTTRDLMVEAGKAVPSAPVARKVASPRSGTAS